MTDAKRSRARRGEGDRLRAEILAAAKRLLIATGDADAVSIRSIAEAVGVTAPSIYLHFADKTELLYTVCENVFAELDRVIEAAAAGAAGAGDELRRRACAYVQFGLEHPEEYRILFMRRPDLLHEEATRDRVVTSSAFEHLVGAVDQAMQAGAIPLGDATRVALDLWVCVHGVTSLRIAMPGFPWPDDPATMIDSVIGTYCDGRRSRAVRPGMS